MAMQWIYAEYDVKFENRCTSLHIHLADPNIVRCILKLTFIDGKFIFKLLNFDITMLFFILQFICAGLSTCSYGHAVDICRIWCKIWKLMHTFAYTFSRSKHRSVYIKDDLHWWEVHFKLNIRTLVKRFFLQFTLNDCWFMCASGRKNTNKCIYLKKTIVCIYLCNFVMS